MKIRELFQLFATNTVPAEANAVYLPRKKYTFTSSPPAAPEILTIYSVDRYAADRTRLYLVQYQAPDKAELFFAIPSEEKKDLDPENFAKTFSPDISMSVEELVGCQSGLVVRETDPLTAQLPIMQGDLRSYGGLFIWEGLNVYGENID